MRVALSIMLMQEWCNFICQWENVLGGVPIRIKHLLHSPYLTLTRVISLIYSVCKNFFDTHFRSPFQGFFSNLMASSTALQLGKSLWPSQILVVYRLGKASTTPETQTLPAPNHTPFGSRYTVEHANVYQHIVASS